jgi:uncharacterized ion transporter superfamily protein YfcC
MFKAPDALVIVTTILLFVAGLTWLVPAGNFERTFKQIGERQVEVVVPGTYQTAESRPQSLGAVFTAPLRGFVSASEIIAFVLLVGGAFAMLMRTGAIDAGLLRILRNAEKNKRRKILVIPLLMFIFALAGYSFGMSEETLVFVLITLPLARSMGYDNFVGVSIPFIGAGMGFAGAAFNPFTVGIAQGIADLPLFGGAAYRTLICFVFTAIAALFVMRYARRLEHQPDLRFLPDGDEERIKDVPMTKARTATLFIFGTALVLVIVGAIEWGWYIAEISGLFLAMGLLAALVSRLSVAHTMKAFYSGARDMLPAALIIGLSKAVLLVAADGNIIDTILYALSGVAEGLPDVIAVQLMFAVQGAINFFIPSGSGQAAITIPIMAPLADLMGISRDTAVLAFQFGDGLFNLIIPTSGVTMGILSIARIPFGKWLKFIWPLMLVLMLAAMLFLAFSG